MVYRPDHMTRPVYLLATLLELHQGVVQEQNKKALSTLPIPQSPHSSSNDKDTQLTNQSDSK